MLLAVVGHSRNIGKTSVVAGLIHRLRDRKWTALKITPAGQLSAAAKQAPPTYVTCAMVEFVRTCANGFAT